MCCTSSKFWSFHCCSYYRTYTTEGTGPGVIANFIYIVIVIVMLQYKCYILSSCLVDFSDWFQIVWFDNLSLITAWTQSRGWLPAGKYHFNSLKIPFSARPGSSSNIFSKQRNKLGKALFEGNIEFLWLNSSFGHRYFLPPSQFDFRTQFHICEIWFDEHDSHDIYIRYNDVDVDDDDYNDDDDELIIKRIVAVQALILL